MTGRLPEKTRRIFVDVSVLSRKDARTGIQRVVRAIWLELNKEQRGYDIVAVAGGRRGCYRRIPNDFLNFPIKRLPLPIGQVRMRARRGDIFLGLDLAAHIAPRNAGQFADWRKAGVKIAHIVYDLLPVQHPSWFSDAIQVNYRAWLNHVCQFSDVLLCISQAVTDDLEKWIGHHGHPHRNKPAAAHLRLGSLISESSPSRGVPDNLHDTISWIRSRPTILMVGTIEPRKGYDQVIDAFEMLWGELGHAAPQLVIVGQSGWKTTTLQTRLAEHSLLGPHMRWINDASDEYLEHLYSTCHGLLIASQGEGLGLPLLEAAAHGMPILARDLPVFREVAPNSDFFSGTDPKDLATAITRWLASPPSPTTAAKPLSWKTTVDNLIGLVSDTSDTS